MSPLDEFHLRLGRLTHAAAQLDFNVGLSVLWLLEHNGEPPSDLLSGTKPLKKRLEELERLIHKTFDLTHPEAAADFSSWFQRADELRALRNDYVHARWGVPWDFDGRERFAEYVQLNWNMSPATALPATRLTFADFDKQIAELRNLGNDLVKLQKRYAHLAAPAAQRGI